MTLTVSVGQAFSVEGREAVTQAIYEALIQVESEDVKLAFIIASFEYNFQEILNGAVTQLGNTPLLGFSTSGEITAEGSHRRSVVVALLCGEDIQSRGDWLPEFTDNGDIIIQEIVKVLKLAPDMKGVFFCVADGFSGDYEGILHAFPEGECRFTGCLAGGDLHQERTFQIGGAKVGSGGIASALLVGDKIRLGVGAAHGWQSVGAAFEITQADDHLIQTLDEKPAADSYAELFGRQARDWTLPPLNTLVRLYPLGIEHEGQTSLDVRTPLRVEPDGSLRMSVEVQEGTVGHLLVGRVESCVEAARQATRDALQDLGDAAPKLALVFADVSYQLLLTSKSGSEVEAVAEVLGGGIPIIGGYTFGQLAQRNGAAHPEFLNQHIQVVLIGEEEGWE
jgi:hypothetical protein